MEIVKAFAAQDKRKEQMELVRRRADVMKKMDPFWKEERELSEKIKERYGKVGKNAMLYELVDGAPVFMPLFDQLWELLIQMAPLRAEYIALTQELKKFK